MSESPSHTLSSPPTTTWEILQRFHSQIPGWRQSGLTPEVRKQVADALVADLGLGEDLSDRIERTVEALHGFSSRLVRASLALLYGPGLAASLCHAVFGADLRLTLFAAKPRARRLLIFGETGTGKEAVAEILADTLCALEPKKARYVPINVASLTDSIAAAELFGHERGAYTGADIARKGLFGTIGDGGVVFLDEIGEASATVQAGLLRVIQSGEYQVVGATEALKVRFHVIAATNRPEAGVRRGEGIRSDLYYRLACPAITVSPLRDLLKGDPNRATMIFENLIEQVIHERILGRSPPDWAMNWRDRSWSKGRARELAERTAGYDWPGNLRECTGFIEQITYQGIGQIPTMCEHLMRKRPGAYPAEIGGKRIAESERAGRNPERDTPPAGSGSTLRQDLLAEERRRYAEVARNARTIDDVAQALGVARQTASRRLGRFGLHISNARARVRRDDA